MADKDGFAVEFFERDGVVKPAGIVGGAYDDDEETGGGTLANAASEGKRDAALFVELVSTPLSEDGVPGTGTRLFEGGGEGGSNAAFIFLCMSGPGDNNDDCASFSFFGDRKCCCA